MSDGVAVSDASSIIPAPAEALTLETRAGYCAACGTWDDHGRFCSACGYDFMPAPTGEPVVPT